VRGGEDTGPSAATAVADDLLADMLNDTGEQWVPAQQNGFQNPSTDEATLLSDLAALDMCPVIDARSLKLLENVGSGMFGEVHRGLLQVGNDSIIAACFRTPAHQLPFGLAGNPAPAYHTIVYLTLPSRCFPVLQCDVFPERAPTPPISHPPHSYPSSI